MIRNYSQLFSSKHLEFDKPAYYLTNYYTNIPHQKYINENVDTKYLNHLDTKFATNFLLDTINNLKEKTKQDTIVLFCEPIMGDNPKSITFKNYKLSANERYETLIKYYSKLGLDNKIETNNTFHNFLWCDDKFKYTRRMRASLYGYL